MQQLFFKKSHGLLQQVHAGLPIIGKKEWERKRADINLSFIVRKSHLTTFFSFCFDRKSLFVLSQLTETVILFLSNWRPDFLPETDALLTQSLLGVLKWANHGLFFVYFRSSSNKQYIFLQQINVKNVMSIQYTELGFKPTTSQTWFVSHNH